MARKPSAAVLAARERRKGAAARDRVRMEWYIDSVAKNVNLTMRDRSRLAGNYLRDQVVKNISRPVTKVGRGRVEDRSKPGEFPKADTTNLMKSIFTVSKKVGGAWEAYVGTSVTYGAILELSKKLDRSFLVRTLNEEKGALKRILTGPITTGFKSKR